MKRNKFIYMVLTVWLTALFSACQREESVTAAQESEEITSVIHYTARVEGARISGKTPTRATLDGNDQYVFQTGDRLYLEYKEGGVVKMYGFLDLPTGAEGEFAAVFEGDLSCVGGFEPEDTTPLTAVLVSDTDAIHTITDGKVTATDYSGTVSASLQEAIEECSDFKAEGFYASKVFALLQSSSFVSFNLFDVAEAADAGDEVEVSIYQGDDLFRGCTVEASAAGRLNFTMAFPGGTVFSGAKLVIGEVERGITDAGLQANHYYTV